MDSSIVAFLRKQRDRSFLPNTRLVEGINPRTLSSRLDSLEAEGIIEKVTAPEKSRCEYRLTKKGAELTPILRDMQAWSEHYA